MSIFQNSPSGRSYEAAFKEIAKENPRIRRIFEWGPGCSTVFLLNLFRAATVYGVEHDKRWMTKCEQLMNLSKRVKITHEPIGQPGKNGAYVTMPLYLGEKFDLIFVDGRLRKDCLAVAPFCLSENGVVVLHDAKREHYKEAFRFYEPSKIENNTIVLRLKNREWNPAA